MADEGGRNVKKSTTPAQAIPVHTTELVNKLQRAERRFTQEYQREPADEDLAAMLDLTIERVRELRAISRSTTSLDKSLADDEDAALEDFIADEQSPSPEGLLAGSSIYPSIQNLMLAARAEGLGTVLTTPQEGIMELLRTELGIPAEARPVAIIPMGWPAVNFGPVTRKPVNEFLHWDRWGERGA